MSCSRTATQSAWLEHAGPLEHPMTAIGPTGRPTTEKARRGEARAHRVHHRARSHHDRRGRTRRRDRLGIRHESSWSQV